MSVFHSMNGSQKLSFWRLPQNQKE